MSIASSHYNHHSYQGSYDIDDLKQQIKILYDQNSTLSINLQDLITICIQLIESIEDYTKMHSDNFGPYNHVELQELANRVIQLKKQFNHDKHQNQKYNNPKFQPQLYNNQRLSTLDHVPNLGDYGKSTIQQKRNRQYDSEQDQNVEQILKVIQQLTKNMHQLQQQYHLSLSNLHQQLQAHRQSSSQLLSRTQQKLISFNSLFKQLMSQMQYKDQVIASYTQLGSNQNRNKKSQIQKQMKISLTIQDLKITLQRKIQEKQNVIKQYQKLIQRLRAKFSQQF